MISQYDKLIGITFNKLTIKNIVKKHNGTRNILFAECDCSCGEKTISRVSGIKSGKVKSCGCLIGKHLENYRGVVKKYSAEEAAYRDLWNNFYKKEADYHFELFKLFIKSNCHYCGCEPKNTIRSRRLDCGKFNYNGLDRVDNNLPHIKSNIVSSCHDCNWAKSDRNQIEFYDWIHKIANMKHYEQNVTVPTDKFVIASAKQIWMNNYSDSNLSFDDFLNMSQCNCFYCGDPPKNLFNRYMNAKYASKKAIINGNFIYNGLDRINSSLPHTKSNLVPCCKYCNRAKLHKTQKEFMSMIDIIHRRLYE